MSCQTTFSPSPSPGNSVGTIHGPERVPRCHIRLVKPPRRSRPSPAHGGIGAVRTRPCFPAGSQCTGGHRAVGDIVERERSHFASAASPQPSITAEDGAVAQPAKRVVISGALSSACACRSDSQLPTRMPCLLSLFTRLIPAASSRREQAVVRRPRPASLRIADILNDASGGHEPRRAWRSYRDTRHALTVALGRNVRAAAPLLEPSHKFIQCHAVYALPVISEETCTLSRTSVFNFCHWAIFSRLIKSFI